MSPDGSVPDQAILLRDMRGSLTDKVDRQLWGVIWVAPKVVSLPVLWESCRKGRIWGVLGSQIGFESAESIGSRFKKTMSKEGWCVWNLVKQFGEVSTEREEEIVAGVGEGAGHLGSSSAILYISPSGKIRTQRKLTVFRAQTLTSRQLESRPWGAGYPMWSHLGWEFARGG